MGRIARFLPLLLLLSTGAWGEDLAGVWRAPDRLTRDAQYYRITRVGDNVFCEVYPAGALVWNAETTGGTSLEGELRVQPIDVGGGRVIGESGWFAHTIDVAADGLSFKQKVGDRLRDVDEEEAEVRRPVRDLGIYNNRFGEPKLDAIHQYGTTAATPAIKRGLAYLARTQQPPGHWNGRGRGNAVSATAFALLAFLADGHTETTGKHKEVVAKGLRALRSAQKGNGSFGGSFLYWEGLATLALVEAFAMSGESYRSAAQGALGYIVSCQRKGGWRYRKGQNPDTSVTGMMFQPLKQGQLAFLVSPEPLDKARAYIDRVTSRRGYVGYQSAGGNNAALTAIGNLIRIYSGVPPTDARVRNGLAIVLKNRNGLTGDYYFMYYGTLLAFLAGNESWTQWRDVMLPHLLGAQIKEGAHDGAWAPKKYAGDLTYTDATAIAILSLAAPYRYTSGRVNPRPDDWKQPITFTRVGVAKEIDPPTIEGKPGAPFSFRIVGTELKFAGSGADGPKVADVALNLRAEAPPPSGMVISEVAVRDDGSLHVRGTFGNEIAFGMHRVQLAGALVPRGHELVLEVRPAGLQISGPRFCLVDHEIELTAQTAAEVRWEVDPPHAATLTTDGRTALLKAGSSGRIVTVRLAETDGPTVEHEVTLWDLRPEERLSERRVHPHDSESDSSWESFLHFLRPDDEARFAEIVETGAWRLVRLRDEGEDLVAEYALSGDGTAVRFEDESVRDFIHVTPEDIRWNGRLPEIGIEPGKHRLDFTVRNGEHEKKLSYEFWLDTTGGVLDIQHIWRVKRGPARGWLVQGRAHGGGKVSLDTAPGVVIAGSWSAPRYPATVDLLPAGDIAPAKREMDDRISTIFVVRGLRQARIEGGRRIELIGKPEGLPWDSLRLERISWNPEILRDRSTYRFDPGSRGFSRPGTFGLTGGRVAQIRILRSPRPAYDEELRGFDARARVLDPEGAVVATALAARTPDEATPDAPLRVRINSRRGRVMAIWTGKREDGTAFEPGKYSIEVVVREGMAEKTLRHDVLLGQKLEITDMPRHFAPGAEDVPITFDWRPRENRASKYLLTIEGREGRRQTIVDRQEVIVREEAGKLKTVWTKTDQKLALDGQDWTELIPFRVTLTGVGHGSETEAGDSRELTVIPTEVTLVVVKPSPSTNEEKALLARNHLSVDHRQLPVRAQLQVLSSKGQHVPAQFGASVTWSFDAKTRYGMPNEADRRPALLDAETRRVTGAGQYDGAAAITGETRVLLRDGKSSVLFRPPVHAFRESLDGSDVPADTFSVKAKVGGVEAESATFTIAVGAPARVRQLLSDQLSDRFNLDHFSTQMWGGKKYVDTLAAQVGRFLSGPASGPLISALAGELKSIKVRYLGKAINIPGGRNDSMEVFLAGFAGADHAALGAGQAVIIVYQIMDAYGNALPRDDTVSTSVKTDDDGLVPPFVLRANEMGSRIFDCTHRKIYDPFRYFRKENIPYGLYGFYYVPGRTLDTSLLRQDLGKLEAALKRNGDNDPLRLPADREIDHRTKIEVRFRGKSISSDAIQLVRSGSHIPLKSTLGKYLKWAVFAEVSDEETLKLEIAVGIIPVVGDGRDIAIYLLKDALGRELTGWDDLFVGLAIVGLIADLGDLHPVGIAANAALAAIKATAKLLKSAYRWTSNAVIAFREMLQPVLNAVRRMGIDDAPRLLRLMEDHLGDFLTLMRDAAKSGNPMEMARKIFRFVNGCNPQKCLKLCSALGYRRCTRFNEFPDVATRALDLLARKIDNYGGQGRRIRAVFDDLMKVGENMVDAGKKLERSASAMKALAKLMDYARKLPNPAEFLRRIARMPRAAQRNLRSILARDEILKFFKSNPEDLAFFLRQFARPRTAAKLVVLMKHMAKTGADCRQLFDALRTKGVRRYVEEVLERLPKLEGKSGKFADLDKTMRDTKALHAELKGIKAADIPDTKLITPNHIPPDSLLKHFGVSRADGGAINMTMARHLETKSYGLPGGKRNEKYIKALAKPGADKAKIFQAALKADIKDMRAIAKRAGDSKMYDEAIEGLVAYCKKNFKDLMKGYP